MQNKAEIKNTDYEKAGEKIVILVYGDNKNKDIAKAIWSSIHGQEIEIVSIETEERLIEKAEDAHLVLIFITDNDDENINLAGKLSRDSLVCADLIAIMEKAGKDQHFKMFSKGFDAIFDLSFTNNKEISSILRHRIEKAGKRLKMYTQAREYEKFRAALDASPDSYIVLDEERRLIFVSNHYRKAYPLGAGKLRPGMGIEELYRVLATEQGIDEDDPQYPVLEEFWLRMDGEAKFKLKNGRVWRLRGRRLPENQGHIIITTDITEYEKQQTLLNEKSDELEEALGEAQEANKLQNQFINMVSHEFRTPLTIIDGNVQILQKRGVSIDPEKFQRHCKAIRSAVSRLVYIMEGILSSNMVRSGRFQIILEEFDLKNMIRELCEEYIDLSKSLDLSYDIETLPDRVYTDKKVVALVLSNLLSNAVKFSKDSPDIKLMARQDGDSIVIEVEDKGVGIPENELDKIFERYYRASTASGVAGTGIGLHLARELLSMLGGSICVESNTGIGTKFIVKIPMDKG